MKVLVIGATGATGKLAVERLLARGDEVTAFVRNPSAMTEKHDRLRLARGEARDGVSLEQAMAGQDAVFVAFGPRSMKKDDLQEVLMRNLLVAMKKNGVKRMVNLSAWGASASRDSVPFFFKIIRGTIFRALFADKERGEALLYASDVEYVNVQPGRLLDKPARGGIKASLDGRGIKASMTRADLADFMIAQLQSDTWVRKSPIIGY